MSRNHLVKAIPRLLLALWLAIGPAWAGSVTLLGVGKVGTTVSPPSLDGSAKSSVGGNNTNTVTLTTTKTNDEIIVIVVVNGCNGGVNDNAAVTSSHLTFTLRKASTGTGGGNCIGTTIMEFAAPSSGTLTSEVITMTVSPGAGVDYSELLAFGVNGINTGSPFDANASIPAGATSGALSMTNTHATNFAFAAFRAGSPPTPDSGWTTIINGSFCGVEYQQITTTQTLTPGGSNSNNGGVGDEIVSP